MKILLLHVPAKVGLATPKQKIKKKASIVPPLGLLYLGSALEEAGHSVELIDYFAEKNPLEKIKQKLPSVDVVGISVFTFAYEDVVEITRMIKSYDETIPIIIGGPHCSFYPDQSLLDIPYADISIEGEGEKIIADVINALGNKKSLSEIPGVRYRDKNKIKKGKPIEVIKDLDSVLFPARHLVDKYDYGIVNDVNYYKPKFTSIMTSRGCPFKCRFCTRHIVGVKYFRRRSVENVIQELQEISKKYNSVLIVDDNFLAVKKWVHQIMDKIIENKIDLEIYILGARVDTADRALYEKMKKAGVKHLQFGIESGTQEVLDFYNKKITLEQIRKAVSLSKEMGFVTIGNFILGAPIETRRHIKKTIKFACSLDLDVADFSVLRYNKHSDLYNEAYNNGNITDEDGYSTVADKRKGLGHFTQEQLEEYTIEAFRSFYFRPSYLTKELFWSVRRVDFRIINVGLNNLFPNFIPSLQRLLKF